MPTATRTTSNQVARVFLDRWSPRSFTDEVLPDDVLASGFEAARWAPSGFNLQPWRFIYSKRHSQSWEAFLESLSSSNREWASKASALILIASQTSLIWDGKELPATSHSFDAGAAWSNFAHQLVLLGWSTHAIGGFDRDKARAAAKVPEGYAIETLVVVGRRGPVSALSEKLQAREAPSDRKPVQEFAFKDQFRSV